jgi:hypothetical protein
MKLLKFFILTILSVTTYSQNVDNGSTVYLDYNCSHDKKAYLQLYNNTDWSISVRSDELYYYTKKTVKVSYGKEFYAMPNDKEVSLQYTVEKFALPWENVKVPNLVQPDSSFNNWIAPRDNVKFSVPLDYLRDDLQVFVRFNYEWEMGKQGFFNNTPEHRVNFRGITLSNTAQTLCENKTKQIISKNSLLNNKND